MNEEQRHEQWLSQKLREQADLIRQELSLSTVDIIVTDHKEVEDVTDVLWGGVGNRFARNEAIKQYIKAQELKGVEIVTEDDYVEEEDE